MALEDGLPRPDVDDASALRLAEDLFGVTGSVRELGSQQDRNFLISSDGDVLLKISNAAFGEDEIAAQNAVMQHLSSIGLDTPVPLPARDGAEISTALIDGESHLVRLLRFVHGSPLIDRSRLSTADLTALGELVGRTTAALAEMDHDGLRRELQWDLREGERVARALLCHVPDDGRRARVAAALDRVSAALDAVRDRLPEQTVHGDLTDDNLVTRRVDGRHALSGIIDFGDAMRSWRVAEIAVTCTAVLHRDPDDPFAIVPLLAGYAEHVALTDEEIRALWPLVVLRGAVLVVSGLQQMAIDPGNDYAAEALDREWAIFAAADALPFDVAERAIRRALRAPVADIAGPAPARPMIEAAIEEVRLDWASDALRDGEWLTSDPEALERRCAGAVTSRGAIAITRFGEARLTRASAHSDRPPVNVAIGVDVFSAASVDVMAPVAGLVGRTVDGHATLTSGERAIVVAGLAEEVPAGHTLRAGERLGVLSGSATIWTTTAATAAGRHERFVSAAAFDGLLSRYTDPSPLLGAPSHTDRETEHDALLERRCRSYSAIQSHYYHRPPRIERGWREHLIDTDGRHYLDMVNNVTVLGHGHPAVARAAERQWRLLNTNSRFHYSAVTELSERLLSTLPSDAFDSVLLVNSGTEAVDLALRLARAFSGRQDVACVAESYHGWSLAADAVSTSTSDNPRAAETRPGWVHVLDAPNAYRGRHRGADAGREYASDAVRALTGWSEAGSPIGTFIAEPRNGNAGGIAVPPGYLGPVYDAVRHGGGVCISDEVQVGYGRQGSVFWGFEEHGVVPDIVTIAKGMGDGHPLGAVITRAEIVEALSDQGSVFSSAGGSTLSARIGVTVFDTIRDEDLQGNALRVGRHLRARLEELAETHALIGAVHGQGLYLGLELVRDRESLEPAAAETADLCDRMLDLGVIIQPTGDRGNVLKIKPPLCFSERSADAFVDALDRVLRELAD